MRGFMEKKCHSVLATHIGFLMVSLFLFACLSTVLTGDFSGRDFYFAPITASILVFLISWIRHKLDFNRKDAEWEQYCKGYLERINRER